MLDFYTIVTEVNIEDAAAYDYVVGIVATRCQPAILGAAYPHGDKFVVKFALDKMGVWNTTPGLLETLIEHGQHFGFTADNTSVLKADRI